ncbi:NADH dehydrogenase 1 alpha subcomplex subunit 6 [Dacryopinax primogenitus]|uniref:NADH dehydrogenase 1 alpha subcomplex subunit 6 n=1 Tax=Dacryopinax primogenitus (strain DJM 731) TaxID=1858805 RepID=M5G8Y8_DACPD|nr:NADH dehydrogenase 1 alpha subcomplex subunit 6 [Dacryopinax primogenitus]EJU00238.1 NADH dehydrogenase 1 alpha subcomplex subunit 6 [Dacryopinax primogenitus]
MTTIPARLAKRAVTHVSVAAARPDVLALYRDFYRAAPEICDLYAIDIPPSLVRARFRQEFERNKHISDVKVLDVLLLKGRQEYQEIMNTWKMRAQLLALIMAPIERQGEHPTGFLDAFYSGKDALAVAPLSP